MTDLQKLKKALWHYRLSRFYFIFEKHFNTHEGFCRYFYKQGYSTPKSLIVQRPSDYEDYPFWFKEGAKIPRINCLINAIKLENEN